MTTVSALIRRGIPLDGRYGRYNRPLRGVLTLRSEVFITGAMGRFGLLGLMSTDFAAGQITRSRSSIGIALRKQFALERPLFSMEIQYQRVPQPILF